MSTSEKLIKLGYKIKKNWHGYYCIYYKGYRQHPNNYCDAIIAQQILDKHKES